MSEGHDGFPDSDIFKSQPVSPSRPARAEPEAMGLSDASPSQTSPQTGAVVGAPILTHPATGFRGSPTLGEDSRGEDNLSPHQGL